MISNMREIRLLYPGFDWTIKHWGGMACMYRPDSMMLKIWLTTLSPTQIHKFLKGLYIFLLRRETESYLEGCDLLVIALRED